MRYYNMSVSISIVLTDLRKCKITNVSPYTAGISQFIIFVQIYLKTYSSIHHVKRHWLSEPRWVERVTAMNKFKKLKKERCKGGTLFSRLEISILEFIFSSMHLCLNKLDNIYPRNFNLKVWRFQDARKQAQLYIWQHDGAAVGRYKISRQLFFHQDFTK